MSSSTSRPDLGIGPRLRALVDRDGITQRRLVDDLGMKHEVRVSQIVRGHARPTLDELIAFARYFGVTTDGLLGLEPLDLDPYPPERRS